MRILRAFGEPRQQVTVGDIAELLNVHKSTASRLVTTLVTTGFLAGGGDAGPLRLGPELVRLGRMAAGGADLAEIARVPMDKLASRTGETVTLSVREGEFSVTIAQSGGTHRVGVQSWVGARTPVSHTADGKVLLAFGRTEANEVPHRLRHELVQVRTQEWASARGELEEHLYGVAVPVWGDDQVLAALCISGPSYRVSIDRFEELTDQLRQSAYEITDARHHYLGTSA